MPFRVGPTEIIVIMAILVLIFGAKRIPQLGSAMGRAIRFFRQGVSGDDNEAMADRKG